MIIIKESIPYLADPPSPQVRDTDCIDIYLYLYLYPHLHSYTYIIYTHTPVYFKGLLSILFRLQNIKLKKRNKERVKKERKENIKYLISSFILNGLRFSKSEAGWLSTQYCGLSLAYYLQLPVFLAQLYLRELLRGYFPVFSYIRKFAYLKYHEY